MFPPALTTIEGGKLLGLADESVKIRILYDRSFGIRFNGRYDYLEIHQRGNLRLFKTNVELLFQGQNKVQVLYRIPGP